MEGEHLHEMQLHQPRCSSCSCQSGAALPCCIKLVLRLTWEPSQHGSCLLNSCFLYGAEAAYTITDSSGVVYEPETANFRLC